VGPEGPTEPRGTPDSAEASDEDDSGSDEEEEEAVDLRAALLRSRELLVDTLPAIVGCAVALLLSGLFRRRRPPTRPAARLYADEWDAEEAYRS